MFSAVQGHNFCNIFFHVIFSIFHLIYSFQKCMQLWHNQLLEWLQLKLEHLHVLTDCERLGFFWSLEKNANVTIFRFTETLCVYCLLMFRLGGMLLTLGSEGNSCLQQNSHVLKFSMKATGVSLQSCVYVRSFRPWKSEQSGLWVAEHTLRELARNLAGFYHSGTLSFDVSFCQTSSFLTEANVF